MSIAAQKRGIALPETRAIDAEIDLGTNHAEFLLAARLRVSLPGMEGDKAQALVDTAHSTCPYSKALRGNIDIAVSLV